MIRRTIAILCTLLALASVVVWVWSYMGARPWILSVAPGHWISLEFRSGALHVVEVEVGSTPADRDLVRKGASALVYLPANGRYRVGVWLKQTEPPESFPDVSKPHEFSGSIDFIAPSSQGAGRMPDDPIEIGGGTMVISYEAKPEPWYRVRWSTAPNVVPMPPVGGKAMVLATTGTVPLTSRAVIPLWLPALLFLGVRTLFLIRPLCRRWRRKHGRCIECGYSLKGLTESRCPECGATGS